MGHIFDIHSAKLYESWYRSSHGRAMDKMVGRSIRALLEPKPGERVLDIGCGEGNHLLLFSKLGIDISGLDASPYMISRARERLGNRCSLKTGTAEDLPFDDNEFDLAVLINTIEYLDDPLRALEEAGRVAKRKVFIAVLNSLSWHTTYQKMQGLFGRSIFKYARSYNLWELKSHVKSVFGDVPITWHCAQVWPSFMERLGRYLTDRWHLNHCPFGSFLGVSVTIAYRLKTDQHPLKVSLKRAGQSVARGVTMNGANRMGRKSRDERSVFI